MIKFRLFIFIVFVIFTANGYGENIALGKKYTMSALPTVNWVGCLKPVPDYNKILTDGIFSKTTYPWTSNKNVSFCPAYGKNKHIDIIVDLETLSPISEIYTYHGATPEAGIFLPEKEEYWVSNNGVDFFKAGEFKNKFDNYSIQDFEQQKAKFTKGVKRYGISGLKTRGRYVLVRTYSSSRSKYNYVNYDEICVIKGDFSLATAKTKKNSYLKLKPFDLPASVLGYRVKAMDWAKLVKENPLYLALAPNQFLGDDEYYISIGGAYVMTFSPLMRSSKKITDIVFNCELPTSVEFISYNKFSKLLSKNKITKNGLPYIKYSFKLPLQTDWSTTYMKQLYLVIGSKSGKTGKLGRVYYSYSYKADNEKYERASSFSVVAIPKITAVAPKRFFTAFWMPYQCSALANNKKSIERIVNFYHELGFNSLNGGGPVALTTAYRKNNMTFFCAASLENGSQLLGVSPKKGERFIYHPKTKRNIVAFCPTLLCNSSEYRAVIKKKFARTLKYADHIYSNWEPFFLFKQGCICERCKKEFQKFAKMNDAQIDKVWPDIVIDKKNKLHNRFSSYQFGKIIKMAQKLVRETGREMKLKHKPDFVLSMAPQFFDSKHSWYKFHNPQCYLKDVNNIIFWNYPNTVNPTAFDLMAFPGNNLDTVGKDIDDINKIVKKIGRKINGKMLPRIIFLQTEFANNYMVMPKDYYFTSLLCLFDNMAGYGTWSTHFKCDARYTALNARANGIISQLEDIVLDGKKIKNAVAEIVSPIPKKINKTPVKLLIVRAFKHKNKELIALGNDYIYDVYVKLKVKGLSSEHEYCLSDSIGKCVYQKTTKKSYSARDLEAGVLVRLSGKEWAAFTIESITKNNHNYTVYTKAEVRKQLVRETGKLKEALKDFR